MSIYITGDKHSRFDDVARFCTRFETTKNDYMIILGDSGINYYDNYRQAQIKRMLSEIPITFVIVRGNHEARPKGIVVENDINSSIYGYFIQEEEYPRILYAIDGSFYTINSNNTHKDAFVMGGAYSVDKEYRLNRYKLGNHDYKWFSDEQMTEEEMEQAFNKAKNFGGKFDYIFTHTCPRKYEPTEMFLPFVDQSGVDKSMEIFFDKFEEEIEYDKWYCGHWHTDKKLPNITFMYNSIQLLE